MLTIGDFARMTHLSVRTLRRYHEAGLLEPAHVDPSSGYRYYDAAQIPTAQVIFKLRELDVPLADVRRILVTQDPAVRAALVAEHLKRLEDRMARTRAAVASLQRLLRPDPAGIAVELRQVPAQLVAGVEATVAHPDVLGRPTSPARATPRSRPGGGRRSAGRCSASPARPEHPGSAHDTYSRNPRQGRARRRDRCGLGSQFGSSLLLRIARHERLIAKGGSRLELDHYLEALVRKPGALPGATALDQARSAGKFTPGPRRLVAGGLQGPR